MYAELYCPECKINFELFSESNFQIDYIICVECGNPKIKVLRSDEDLTSRLEKVIVAVKELIERVEVIEECVNADIGPKRSSGKETIN